MAIEPTKAIRVFYCYAHEDKLLRNELERHLGALKRSGRITTWSDREIQPGTQWANEIDTKLSTSDVILLLISSYFIDSDYCWGVEMAKALERHKAGQARVIPIILRPVDWEETPISELQVLPTAGKPVTQWSDSADAFLDVARGIRKVVKELSSEDLVLAEEDVVPGPLEIKLPSPENMRGAKG